MGVGAAIGGAAQGAGTVAATALQVNAEKQARQTAINTANSVAPSITNSATTANALLAPYASAGTNALSSMSGNSAYNSDDSTYTNAASGNVTQAGNEYSNLLKNGITQQSIENTPGWSAINALGQQGVTNAAAARGLANSGAAEKGAANYATTMADQTYQNLYNDQLSTASGLLNTGTGNLAVNNASQGNLTNEFNRQNALANYGSNALTQQGNNTMTAANNAGQIRMEGANGAMATTVGAGNALASGLSSLGNTASQYSMYNALLNGSGSSSSDPFSGSGESAW